MVISIPIEIAESPTGAPLYFDTTPGRRGFYDPYDNKVSSLELAKAQTLDQAMAYVKKRWPVESAPGKYREPIPSASDPASGKRDG